MPTLADVDVDSLISGAFDESECVADVPRIEHSGGKRGYLEWHGCFVGFICEGHFDWLVMCLQAIADGIGVQGSGICGYCGRQFFTADSFAKLHPL